MILSVDGSYMLHRARHVSGKNDTPTKGHVVLLFMRLLIGVAEKFNPDQIYVYFDRGRSVHRRQIHEKYKAQRKRDPDDLTLVAYEEARTFLVEHLPSLGVISVLEDGIEADDFAYLLAATNDGPGVHVSDDKDWYLNIFPNWHLYRAKADELVSYEDLCTLVESEENPRLIYLMTRAMIGDKSDNIAGLRGFGWKTALPLATKLINKEPLGDGAKAKSLDKGMKIVKRNMSVMNPSWILHDENAKAIINEAEQKVVAVENPLESWVAFVNLLDSEHKAALMNFWNRYNRLARSLNNGHEPTPGLSKR